jgi:dolichol-phosphate mannosyltransferase
VSAPTVPSFAVVIPAYNEEAGLRAIVQAVDSSLRALPNRTAIIVVDDGSLDSTSEELAALDDEYSRLVALRHGQNFGYGSALRTGTAAAAKCEFDYVLFMDSDLTNDPRYLADFAAEMSDGHDVIKASRYVSGGGIAGVPRWHVFLSRAGNAVARLLFGLPIRDCTNGFRAVKTGLLTSIDLQETGFAVIMEELYRLRPLANDYAEVPILLTARRGYQRPSSFSFGPRAMMRYLRYPFLSALHRRR